VTTLATVLLVIAALAAAFPWIVRIGFRAPRIRERGSPEQLGLAYREVSIPTENGKHLFAWLVPPPVGGPAPTVAVLHGWGGNAEMMLPLAQPLHRAGYAVLLLDSRNHGRSDSDGFSSLPRFAEDLDRALDWLALQPEADAARLAALGHSVGAAAALLVASRRPELSAVASIAAFADPESMMRRFLAAHHVPYFPLGRLVLRYVQHAIGHRFSDIAPKNTIRQVRCPVLLVHGSDDATVPVDDAMTIYARRPGDQVRLLILAGDHDTSREAERHAGKLIEFLDQALGRGSADQSRLSVT
jgi:dipeptidyl aminopeptidase/acylaminoacyl peptidase